MAVKRKRVVIHESGYRNTGRLEEASLTLVSAKIGLTIVVLVVEMLGGEEGRTNLFFSEQYSGVNLNPMFNFRFCSLATFDQKARVKR